MKSGLSPDAHFEDEISSYIFSLFRVGDKDE